MVKYLPKTYEDCKHFHFISDRSKGVCEYKRNVRNTHLCGKKICPHYKSKKDLLGKFDYDYLKDE